MGETMSNTTLRAKLASLLIAEERVRGQRGPFAAMLTVEELRAILAILDAQTEPAGEPVEECDHRWEPATKSVEVKKCRECGAVSLLYVAEPEIVHDAQRTEEVKP